MSLYYILQGKEAVPVETIEEWAEWRSKEQEEKGINARRVARDIIGDIEVSTVFLGIDHSFGEVPELFETMIFGGVNDLYEERYTTWEEAERGHAEAVRLTKAGVFISDESL